MSAQAATTATRTQKVLRFRRQGKMALFFSTIAATVPFAPAWMVAAAAAAAAGYAAYLFNEAERISKPPRPDSRYDVVSLNDAEIVRHTYIGHGMDFTEYRNGLDQLTDERGGLSRDDRRAYHYSRVKEMKPTYLQDDIATRHQAVMGSTGLGKTELFTSMMIQSIKRGGGGIILDAKGDEKLLTRLYAIAKEYGRLDDLMFINFDRPEISHTYNPILNGNARQIISTMMKLQGATKEEFFKRLNRNALSAAIVCLQSQSPRVNYNFSDLAVLFNDLDEFINLYNQIPKEKTVERQFVYQFLNNFRGYDQRTGDEYLKRDYYRERLLGLFGIMMDFCHSQYRQILNAYNPDLELKRAIEQNKIVVVAVPALSDKEGVVLFSKLFLADLSRAIGEIQLDRQKPLIPYPVFLDEYGSFKDETHQELFQLARSAMIQLVLSVQGRGFLTDESEQFADNLLTNCWNHIYLDVRDPKTRESACELAGTVLRKYSTVSEGESFGFSHRNADTGALRTENSGKSYSKGYKEMRETLLQPDDFEMDEGEALLVGKAGVVKLQLPIVQFDCELPSLDELELPHFEKERVEGLNLMEKALAQGGDFSHLIESGAGR